MFSVDFKPYSESVRIHAFRDAANDPKPTYKIARLTIVKTAEHGRIKVLVETMMGASTNAVSVGPIDCPTALPTWADLKPSLEDLTQQSFFTAPPTIQLIGPDEAYASWTPNGENLKKFLENNADLDLCHITFTPTYALLKNDNPEEAIDWLKNFKKIFGVLPKIYELLVEAPLKAMKRFGIDKEIVAVGLLSPLIVAASFLKPENAMAKLLEEKNKARVKTPSDIVHDYVNPNDPNKPSLPHGANLSSSTDPGTKNDSATPTNDGPVVGTTLKDSPHANDLYVSKNFIGDVKGTGISEKDLETTKNGVPMVNGKEFVTASLDGQNQNILRNELTSAKFAENFLLNETAPAKNVERFLSDLDGKTTTNVHEHGGIDASLKNATNVEKEIYDGTHLSASANLTGAGKENNSGLQMPTAAYTNLEKQHESSAMSVAVAQNKAMEQEKNSELAAENVRNKMVEYEKAKNLENDTIGKAENYRPQQEAPAQNNVVFQDNIEIARNVTQNAALQNVANSLDPIKENNSAYKALDLGMFGGITANYYAPGVVDFLKNVPVENLAKLNDSEINNLKKALTDPSVAQYVEQKFKETHSLDFALSNRVFTETFKTNSFTETTNKQTEEQRTTSKPPSKENDFDNFLKNIDNALASTKQCIKETNDFCKTAEQTLKDVPKMVKQVEDYIVETSRTLNHGDPGQNYAAKERKSNDSFSRD